MKKLKFIAVIFCFVIFDSPVFASEPDYSFSRDFPKKLESKLNERIKNKNIYFPLRYYSNPDRITELETHHTRILSFYEQEFIPREAQNDGEDALSYALEDYFNRDPFWRRFRQITIGIGSIEIRREKEDENLKTLPPSIDKPLDYYDETLRTLEIEQSSLGGDTLEAKNKELEIKEKIWQLKEEIKEAKPLRIRLGIDSTTTISRISNYRNYGFRLEPFLLVNSYQTESKIFYRTTLRLDGLSLSKDRESGFAFEKNFFERGIVAGLGYLSRYPENTNWLEISFRRVTFDTLTFGLTHRYGFESQTNEEHLELFKTISPQLAINLNTFYNWQTRNYQANIGFFFQF